MSPLASSLPLCRSDLARLVPAGGWAVELGVAAGEFSQQLLEAGPQIGCLVSVDRWSDHHDAEEEAIARARLAPYGARSRVIRATFAEARPLFGPGCFALVYVDGYAHTGQEGGATLRDWWPTVAPGGILAGHDYDPAWPETIAAVDEFVRTHALKLHLVPPCPATRYGSWWVSR